MVTMPPGTTYGRVHGTLIRSVMDGPDVGDLPDVEPATGYIRIICDADYVTNDANDVVILPEYGNINLDDQGHFSVAVVASDSPGLNPTMFTYTVSFFIKDANIPNITIQVLAGTDVDLTELIPVAVSSGVLTIRGPKGDKGDPGVSDITAAEVQTQVDRLDGRIDALSTPQAAVLQQTTPASVWSFANPFGRLVGVALVIGGQLAMTDIAVSTSTITATFPTPQTGYLVVT